MRIPRCCRLAVGVWRCRRQAVPPDIHRFPLYWPPAPPGSHCLPSAPLLYLSLPPSFQLPTALHSPRPDTHILLPAPPGTHFLPQLPLLYLRFPLLSSFTYRYPLLYLLQSFFPPAHADNHCLPPAPPDPPQAPHIPTACSRYLDTHNHLQNFTASVLHLHIQNACLLRHQIPTACFLHLHIPTACLLHVQVSNASLLHLQSLPTAPTALRPAFPDIDRLIPT